MAVQKSKKSKSKRGHRRSHDSLKIPTLFLNKKTNEICLYHHISKKGFYRNKKINV